MAQHKKQKLTMENMADGVDRLMNDASFMIKAFDVTVLVGVASWLLTTYLLCLVFLSAPTRDHFFTIAIAKIMSLVGGGDFNLMISFERAGQILKESHSAREIAKANGAWSSAWTKVMFWAVLAMPMFFYAARKFSLFAAKHGLVMGAHEHLRGAKVVTAEELDTIIKEAHEKEIIKRAIVLEKQRKASRYG